MRWKNYLYSVSDNGVTIEKYFSDVGAGSSEEEDLLTIPSQIDGLPVTEIGEEAFTENGAYLAGIEVPPTVRRIGRGAFKMCMSLTELVLHEGLEEIGEDALYLTPLTEVFLPSTVRRIDCPWELSSILFSISDANPYFFTDGYCMYSRNEGMERTLLVAFSEGGVTDYHVPEGTTVIGESAFAGNETLKRVDLPLTVHTIEATAFEGCRKLSEVRLQDGMRNHSKVQQGESSELRRNPLLSGLRRIGENAFSHCICLRHIHLPSTVEEIGRFALSDTFGWSEELNGLERITVDAANTHFSADGDALFEIGENGERYIVKYFGTGTSYRIPEDVSRILPGAFRRAVFYRCRIPKSVRDIGEDAFRECKNLEEAELEESGTRLYIPQEPVYRKDEIADLFFSVERETRSENQFELQRDETRTERKPGRGGFSDLPAKWKDFAAFYPDAQRQKRHSWEGYIFDYRGYDALFPTYLSLMVRCGMACCRLKYPVLLNGDTAAEYRRFVNEKLPEILYEIAKTQDLDSLASLAELGFFTEDNIEECIAVFAGIGKTKCTGFLLNYKREHLENADFDFSL